MSVVLNNNCYALTKLLNVQAPQISPVPGDLPFVGVIEATEQFDDRGLASTILTHEQRDLARFDLQVDPVKSWPIASRIAEAHTPEMYA